MDAPLHVWKSAGQRLRIPSVNDMRLLREYNKKYLGYANYDPSTASLGESFYARYLSLSAVGNDTHANDAPLQRGLRQVPSSETHSDAQVPTTASISKHALRPHSSPS
jgi:hypothetical protein